MKPIQSYLACLGLMITVSSCGGASDSSELLETPTLAEVNQSKLQLLTVRSKNKEVEELVSGRVIAKNQTQLVAEVQGMIRNSSVNLKEGVKFRKGDQLVNIDSEEFSLNLKSQKSAFLNALTGIMPDLKADYPDNFEAWVDYLETIDLDAPLAELPQTKSKPEQFFVTSRGIFTSYFGIKSQEERLKKYSVYAPYNGVITQSMVDVGSLVSPGQPLGTIISSGEFELETGVSLKVGAQLKVGDKITFTSNEVSGTWTGTVIRIGGTVDAQTQNIPVFFRISGDSILPGMYLQGHFMSDSYADVFVIPSAALGRDQGVLVLDNDLIVSKSVETIQVFQDSTLVTGLSNNDRVILTQFEQPMAGKKVAL